MTVDAEADRAAATGAFETHWHLNLLGTLFGARKVPYAILGRCIRHPAIAYQHAIRFASHQRTDGGLRRPRMIAANLRRSVNSIAPAATR